MKMFDLNRFETKQIMEGRATGCTRKYGDVCPHVPGAEIIFTSKFLDLSGKSVPFARAQVVSVRPGTVGEFRRDSMIAEIDGYPNGEVWYGQMGVMYKGVKDTDKMHHIKFRIIEIDKQAGRTGGILRK
jgi:hypothetical protein